MSRLLTRAAATLLVLAVLGLTACTTDPTGGASTAATTGVPMSGSTAAPPSDAGGGPSSAGIVAASAPGSPAGATASVAGTGIAATTGAPPAPTSSPAPTGDGHWHPTVGPSGPDSPVPVLVQQLLADQQLSDVRAGSLSQLDRRGFQVTVGRACGALLTALVAGAKKSGMTVVASGAEARSEFAPANWWFVVSDGPVDGVDLALTAGANPEWCSVSGVECTPVQLMLTGPTKASVVGYGAVTCGPAAGGEIVGVWGIPLAGNKPGATVVATVAATGPGKHPISSDGVAYLTTSPVYTMYQAVSLSDLNSGLPTGAIPLSGSVTLEPGLASGSLDLSGGGEHITGTFACGTPVVTG